MANYEEYIKQFDDKDHPNLYILLSNVETSKDRDANLAKLLGCGIKRLDILEVVKFLKANFHAKYPQACACLNIKKVSKPELSNQIITFVYSTVPSHCLKCQNFYLPFEQTEKVNCDVVCYACKVPAHVECY